MYILIYKYGETYVNKDPVEKSFSTLESLCFEVFNLLRGYMAWDNYYKIKQVAAGVVITKNEFLTSNKLIFMATAITSSHKNLDLFSLYRKGRDLYLDQCKARQGSQNAHVYRQGPVEGIHVRKHYRYFRKVKTFQEIAMIAATFKEEGEPDFRAARKSLPNNWDDIHNSSARDRCWKSQRKKRKAWDR